MKPRKYWSCPTPCGSRHLRTVQKCPNCGRGRPKKRVPVHARTLRDDSYSVYCEANELIHGVTDESCAVCGRPRSQERRHDRDHGHLKGSLSFGKPRGLACVSCNRIMVRELTLERAQAVVSYLERVENHYREETP